jgi:crotonobetainyl-CoA:carnitine CoA-transferase CaiB-like acyl-CoA transferase
MRPLQSIRVLDLSRLIPGPFATLVLADLGATVDKLEDTAAGDYLRHLPPHLGGASAAFQLLNRNKRSLVLDLKRPEGREAFLRIVGTYDVILEQFRPGVLDRLGLSHASLLAAHPRLIVCALTGYGQSGELSARAGHDLNYLARSGLLGIQGPSDAPPAVPAFQLADMTGGLWSALAILAALAERERTGLGRSLDIAMTDGVFALAPLSLAATLAGAVSARGDETLTGGLAAYRTYLSKDGCPIALAALEPKFWSTFCAAVGLTVDALDLIPGPHQRELTNRVTAIFASRPRAEWIAFAAEHDCCVEVAVLPAEIRADPHLASRGLVFDMKTPDGPLPQVRLPITPSDTGAFTAPPRSGEHSRAILREGGLDEGAIDTLIRAGVVREG